MGGAAMGDVAKRGCIVTLLSSRVAGRQRSMPSAVAALHFCTGTAAPHRYTARLIEPLPR